MGEGGEIQTEIKGKEGQQRKVRKRHPGQEGEDRGKGPRLMETTQMVGEGGRKKEKIGPE